MIDKHALSSDYHEQQQREHRLHSRNNHSLMCKHCATETIDTMTEFPEEICGYDSRRRPFPTLLYPRIQWNSYKTCQGCMGKGQVDVSILDHYATTRMLDMAAEEELEAAQASGDLDRIREARTIVDFNKKTT